jgi:D-alanyl-D-alanine carboxypeptidase
MPLTMLHARKRAFVASLALISSSVLVLSGCTAGSAEVETEAGKPMSDQTASALQSVLETALDQTGASQIMVGVWAPWEGDFVQGVTSNGSTLSIDTQFRAAQSSQAVVCAALLSAVDDGALSLKRKVSKDLPRQVGIDDITYGQLCEGTSGLADFKKGFEESFANNPARIWPDRELLAAGIVRSPLSAPGAEFHRSDTNSLLLGRALSLALEQPLADILRERVFAPAGMNRSSYPAATSLTLSNSDFVGSNYPLVKNQLQCDALTEVPNVSNSMLGGAGGSVTTVTNLRDFYAKYLSGELVGQDNQGLIMKTLPITPASEDSEASIEQWGFGLMNIGPLWGDAGSITGTLSAAFHDPISGYSVVVAINNSSAGATFAQNLALKLTSVVAENAPGTLADLPWDDAAITEALSTGAVCQPE